MEPNIPLLRKVMEHITAHPEEYDQREYAVRTECGTTHCIAGWAVALSDVSIVYRRLGIWDNRTAGDYGWNAELGSPAEGTWRRQARDLLGLDALDARYLFHEGRTLDEVWRFVEEISDGEVRRPT